MDRIHVCTYLQALQVKFSIEVKGELDWSVLIGEGRLSSDCSVLAALPHSLSSVTNVRKAISRLESLHYCTGNEDEKYFSVQAARKGVFKDSTGKTCVTGVKIYVYLLLHYRSECCCIVCSRPLQLPYCALHILPTPHIGSSFPV